jgi:hypothetical protein
MGAGIEVSDEDIIFKEPEPFTTTLTLYQPVSSTPSPIPFTATEASMGEGSESITGPLQSKHHIWTNEPTLVTITATVASVAPSASATEAIHRKPDKGNHVSSHPIIIVLLAVLTFIAFSLPVAS